MIEIGGGTAYTPAVGTSGAYQYTEAPRETPGVRAERERHWRSVGKRIRKGARIRGGIGR